MDEDSNFRLVMVGRKVSAAEKEERGLRFEETHNVSSAIFHESGE